jgi:hypothetical protein
MLHQVRSKLDPKMKVHGRIIRVTTYSVASLLAVLMLTAVLPPIVADESDRARRERDRDWHFIGP